MPQAAFEAGRLREFRCPAESARSGIEGFLQSAPRCVEGGGVEYQVPARRVRHEPLECQRELRALPSNIVRVVCEVFGNASQEFAKSRQSVSLLLGKIGPAEEGLLLIGRAENGHRACGARLSDV